MCPLRWRNCLSPGRHKPIFSHLLLSLKLALGLFAWEGWCTKTLNQKEVAEDCREHQVTSQPYSCLPHMQYAKWRLGNQYRIHPGTTKYHAVFRLLSETAADPELSPCFLYYPACQQPCAVSRTTVQATFVVDVGRLLSAHVCYKNIRSDAVTQQ